MLSQGPYLGPWSCFSVYCLCGLVATEVLVDINDLSCYLTMVRLPLGTVLGFITSLVLEVMFMSMAHAMAECCVNVCGMH